MGKYFNIMSPDGKSYNIFALDIHHAISMAVTMDGYKHSPSKYRKVRTNILNRIVN